MSIRSQTQIELIVPLSESKRTADAVEGLEKSDVKKPKLDSDAQDVPGDEGEDAEEAIPEEAADEPSTSMEVDNTASASGSEPKIRFKKAKTAEGASAHFKENPYTFIEPTDPIIKGCT